ncbi:MAG: hypothetical protein WD200_01240 [Candidatus Andersenbacteria bacterium]
MLIALLVLIIPALFGATVLSYFKVYSEKVGLIMIGSIGGLAFSVTAAYLIQLVVPQSDLTLLIQTTILAAITGVLLYRGGWITFQKATFDKRALIVFITTMLLFSIISPKLLLNHDEGLSTGIINAYGDITWHTANITLFVEGQSIPPENPIFSDTRLTYPFLVNFFSAMLIHGGASLSASVALPALFLIPLIITICYIFVRDYTNKPSAGIIAALLFLFGGATFGWLRIGSDLAASGSSVIDFLLHLPMRDYSGVGTDQEGFHFLNSVTSLLLPQRSFLFGIPLALSTLILLRPRKEEQEIHYLLAGIYTGLLPLFHGHTTISLALALAGLFLINPSRLWLVFGLTASSIGIPEMLYYAGGNNEPGTLFRFEPRWMAGEENIVWYWIKNTGLLIPVTALGFYLKAPRALKALAVSGLVLFLLSNTFAFAPWIWDNFKLLVFFVLLVLPLVSWTVICGWQKFPSFARVIITVLVIAHIASAGLDIFKLALPTATVWQEWDTNDITAAENIKSYTKPGEDILTAPTHNSAVVLSGRPRYLGYAAHVWSHGELPWERENAIKLFYEGQLDQLPETQPDYVLVGPQEQQMYSVIVRPTWQEVFSGYGYTLYRL